VDRIFVKGLEAECVIGVFDWEREVRQRIRIDLDLGTDVRRAAATDRLEDTVDYKGLSKRVLSFVRESEFGLIESLADRIAAMCLETCGVVTAKVRVSKPGAVRHAETVGVEVERAADDDGGA
jgi:dihydroneopterin aldolase